MSPNPIDSKFPRITGAWTSAVRWGLVMLAFMLFAAGSVEAQSKKQLENRRKRLIQEISVTDKLLKKTTQTKEATYDRFIALQNQIQQRERLIRTINAELDAAEVEIARNAAVTSALSDDLEGMRAEYGRLVRNAYRRKMQTNPLLFILSAGDLNQAFRRWLFLQRYDRLRKEQADAIAFTQNILQQKIVALENTHREKERLLASLNGQRTTLNTELADKDAMLKTLARDESRLRKELETKEQAHEQLNSAIEKIIQEEVRKSVEAARKPKPAAASPAPKTEKPAAGSTKATAGAKPADPAVTDPEIAPVEDRTTLDFRRSRGRLPWPVESGFIARSFGRQKHPTIRNIEITNNGIDIRTDASAVVRAVYGGKVAGVQFIPGHDYTVILQHGNYYTVYSNVSETPLAKGQEVQAKQVIGRVSNNPITGASELHFELWHQKERLNPALWIRR
jgi:septal ring factor EnvC (AmiA/AmiB activator)